MHKLVFFELGLKGESITCASCWNGFLNLQVRSSFVLAEQERSGGISQHTSPVAQVGDVGSLLLNAGFKLPTVDTDVFHINYDDSVEVCL